MKKTQFFALIFSLITTVILSPSIASAEKVQLTPSQQKQILEIQKDATTKLKAILTPAQRAQAEAAAKNGDKKVDLKKLMMSGSLLGIHRNGFQRLSRSQSHKAFDFGIE